MEGKEPVTETTKMKGKGTSCRNHGVFKCELTLSASLQFVYFAFFQ